MDDGEVVEGVEDETESTAPAGVFDSSPLGTIDRILRLPPRVMLGINELNVVDDASCWLGSMTKSECIRIIEVVDGESKKLILDELINEKVNLDELTELWRSTLEGVSGRKWFVAENLTLSILGSWSKGIGGRMALAGIDPFTVSFSTWLDAAASITCDLVGQDNFKKLMIDVNREPVQGVDPDDMTMDADDFRNTMAAM